MAPKRKWIGSKDNIRRFWEEHVTRKHVREGQRWYKDAHDLAVAISETFGTDLPVVCAVLSAYSQNTYWERTVTATIKNLNFYYRYGTVMGMRNTIDTVTAILDNNDPSLLKGPKLNDFSMAILTAGQHPFPVMDRWMARVWLGKLNWMGTVTDAVYQDAQAAYIEVADEMRKARAVLQAGIWGAAIEFGPTRPT